MTHSLVIYSLVISSILLLCIGNIYIGNCILLLLIILIGFHIIQGIRVLCKEYIYLKYIREFVYLINFLVIVRLGVECFL